MGVVIVETDVGRCYRGDRRWALLSWIPTLGVAIVETDVGRCCHGDRRWTLLSWRPTLGVAIVETDVGRCYRGDRRWTLLWWRPTLGVVMARSTLGVVMVETDVNCRARRVGGQHYSAVALSDVATVRRVNNATGGSTRGRGGYGVYPAAAVDAAVGVLHESLRSPTRPAVGRQTSAARNTIKWTEVEIGSAGGTIPSALRNVSIDLDFYGDFRERMNCVKSWDD